MNLFKTKFSTKIIKNLKPTHSETIFVTNQYKTNADSYTLKIHTHQMIDNSRRRTRLVPCILQALLGKRRKLGILIKFLLLQRTKALVGHVRHAPRVQPAVRIASNHNGLRLRTGESAKHWQCSELQ